MITVIIPVLNETRRVASVVRFALAEPLVSEVIVIDDASHDASAHKADFAGARVIQSSMLGKGASMLDGALAASNPVLVYLDGDLAHLEPSLIARLARPVLSGEADFAKAAFSRHAGRVTALTAKPLLQMFFPELADYNQPLGGIIAIERRLMLSLQVASDYGVDIALLIDAYFAGARIIEVQVGEIEHESQSLEALSSMAFQVANVILERAAQYSRLSEEQLEVGGERRAAARLSPRNLELLAPGNRGLVLIAVGGIIMPDLLLQHLADVSGRGEEMSRLICSTADDPDALATGAAHVLRGVHRRELEQAARTAPLNEGIVEAMVRLRRAGFVTGIVSRAFHFAADIIRRRVFGSITLANQLQFRAGLATGHLRFPSHPRSGGPACPRHEACGGALATGLLRGSGVPAERVYAVGRQRDDLCLLSSCGTSIAYGQDSEVAGAVDHVVEARPDSLADFLIDHSNKRQSIAV